MTVFFNGQTIVSPATLSAVNDQALADQNLTTGNVVALLGLSSAGQPNTALTFGNPADALAALQSGELLTAVQNAFSPSNETNGPSSVVAIRVNPATQSTLVLSDVSPTPVINLASTDYGQYTRQISVAIASGSVSGKKITTQLGNNFYTQDNISRTPFSIQYTGGQVTATMTVTATTVVLAAPAGTTVATIDLTVYQTIQQLVDFINTVPGFGATILNGNNNIVAANGLDFVAAQDVKTALYTAHADLQAIVDWFNGLSEGFVTATRVANVGTLPVNILQTFLAGGSDGVVTNTQWSNAFTVLQGIDVQWVTPVSSDPSIAAMADAHVQFMSTVGRKERRALCGTALATSDAAAITAAKAINSDRTSLVHIGYYGFNAAGALTLYSPYLLAAMIAGAFAGISPGTPMTNKSLNVQGLERNLRNPIDTDPLILGGVLCVDNEPTGFKVVKSISTWLVNTKFDKVEVSCGVAADYTARSLRTALDVLRGSKQDPNLLGRAKSIIDSTCTKLAVAEPNGPGVLVGDANSPPFQNIVASIAGDVLTCTVQASVVIPNNYILVTIAAVPFSGSVSA